MSEPGRFVGGLSLPQSLAGFDAGALVRGLGIFSSFDVALIKEVQVPYQKSARLRLPCLSSAISPKRTLSDALNVRF